MSIIISCNNNKLLSMSICIVPRIFVDRPPGDGMLSIDVDRKMDCKVDNVVSCWTFDCDATAAVKSILEVERTYKYIVIYFVRGLILKMQLKNTYTRINRIIKSKYHTVIHT